MKAGFAAAMPDLPPLTRPSDFAGAAARLLPTSLADLELMVRRELDLTRYSTKSWVVPHHDADGREALDCLVVGAGQAGLAACFGLMQQRVGRLLVIDENPEGFEGPWNRHARMPTLRTQKDVGGIDLGVPSLSFRAWYEVQHGIESWPALYKIPTRLWNGYLAWYRRVLALPVRNECRLVRFRPVGDGLIAADLAGTAGAETVLTRTLVLATGMEGNGLRNVPRIVRDGLPRAAYAHAFEDIDFEALRGKTIAVLGGGATAFDAAITAADRGAHAVHLYHRRKTLMNLSPGTWTEFNGYLAHFPDLPIEQRWMFAQQIAALQSGPPKPTVKRAAAMANLHLHAGIAWNGLRYEGGRIALDAADGRLDAEFLILGTGYVTDIKQRPELAEHAGAIALWRDVFTPPADQAGARMLDAPFLGSHFEFQDKRATPSWLNAVFNFSRDAQTSMGPGPTGLSGIKFGVVRLAQGVARRLFLDSTAHYLDGVRAWQASDLSHVDT